MMTVLYLGSGTPDTIISGIILLIQMGMMPVALLIFVASFLVPLGKILGIMILLVSVQRRSKIKPKHRAILYRLVEFLGKWSMLDVFVVAVMAAVVQLGFISEIVAGPGVTAFAIMVILTMFSAHAFDPRLIWDMAENDD
jgi:paraquat-inducible protein A